MVSERARLGVEMTLQKDDGTWFERILNYWMMMERYPNLRKEVGGLIPACEISSLPNEKLASSALVLACRPSV